MTIRKLGFEPRAMLPIVLALLLVALYGAMLSAFILCERSWFGGCDPSAGVPEALETLVQSVGASSPSVNVRAYSTRLLWILTFGLCVLFSLAGLLVGAHIISSSLTPDNMRRRVWKTLLSLMVSVGVAVLFFVTYSGDRAFPWRQLMHSRLQADFPAVLEWTPRLDVLGLIAALFLALAATSLLVCAYQQTRFEESTFRHIVRRTRALLYVGALLLVTSVARSIILFRWSLDYVEVGGEPTTSPARLTLNNLEYLSGSMVLALGTFYTLLLAAIYLPTALLVREQGASLIEPTSEESSAIERWMRDTSIAQRIPRVLAVLSPLLVSPAAELIKLMVE